MGDIWTIIAFIEERAMIDRFSINFGVVNEAGADGAELLSAQVMSWLSDVRRRGKIIIEWRWTRAIPPPRYVQLTSFSM